MNLIQRYNLFMYKKSLAPTSDFKRTLQKQLVARLEAQYGVSIEWYRTHVFRVSTAIVSGFLIVSSVTTSVYAYSSPEVTSASILYPIKQQLESIEEKTKVTPVAKAEFLLKKMQRREAEKVVLQKHNASVEEVDNEIQEAALKLAAVQERLSEVSIVPSSTLAVIQHQVEEKLEKQKERWEKREAKLLEHQRELESMLQSETVKEEESGEDLELMHEDAAVPTLADDGSDDATAINDQADNQRGGEDRGDRKENNDRGDRQKNEPGRGGNDHEDNED